MLPLLSAALAFQAGMAPAVRGRFAAGALKMAEAEVVVGGEAESSMDYEAPKEENTRFKAISLNALDEWAEKFPRLATHLEDIKMSSLIFPFKASPYLVEELIDWDMEGDIRDDPFYRLVFPTMNMLAPHHREKLRAVCADEDPFAIKDMVDEIREDLNPHPAGQKQLNAPKNKDLSGVQHKYDETVLFFPAAAQTCHAYCTYAACRTPHWRAPPPALPPRAVPSACLGALYPQSFRPNWGRDRRKRSSRSARGSPPAHDDSDAPGARTRAGTASAGRSSLATRTCASPRRTPARSSITLPSTRRSPTSSSRAATRCS